MNEIAFIAAALVPVGSLILGGWLAGRGHALVVEEILSAHEAERKVLREELRRKEALLRDAQDRITAKDLQGYVMLQQAQTPRQSYGTRGDAEEAALEARRQSYLQRHAGILEEQEA